jgi:2-polyprenyl-3-methyl-5-hydroxy-6-metoxy-1,4-benzoquinol methylase
MNEDRRAKEGLMTSEKSSQIADYYCDYWAEGGFRPLGYTPPEIAAVMEREIPEGSRCLDYGCGDGGTSSPVLLKRGCRYFGVDVSPTAIQLACKRGLEAELIANPESGRLSLPDSNFDAAVCFEVLEHLFSPLAVATELRRLVRPGGTVLITVPNATYWRRRLDFALLGRWNPDGDERAVTEPWRDPHIRFFTPSTLGAFLRAAGFREVRVVGVAGSLLHDIPVVRRFASETHRSSRLYRLFESLLPGLFAYRLVGICR